MLSNRAQYAIRALLDLTLHYHDGPIQIRDIAARQSIPKRYLELTLLSLNRLGFVRSHRGPGGGYFLARPPEFISLGDVVCAIDGLLAQVSCASSADHLECGCTDPSICGLHAAWQEAHDALAAVLNTTSFADIRDRCIELPPGSSG